MHKDIKSSQLLRICSNQFDRRWMIEGELTDLTSSQIQLLMYMIFHNDRTIYPIDLQQKFQLSKATVSGLLKRLQEKGYIEFQVSKTDNRYKEIIVLEKAYTVKNTLKEKTTEIEKIMFDGFTNDEKTQFHQQLLRILHNLKGKDGCHDKNNIKPCQRI